MNSRVNEKLNNNRSKISFLLKKEANGMLLKYAASYVTKWHDAFADDALFSVHVGPYEAAYRQL